MGIVWSYGIACAKSKFSKVELLFRYVQLENSWQKGGKNKHSKDPENIPFYCNSENKQNMYYVFIIIVGET